MLQTDYGYFHENVRGIKWYEGVRQKQMHILKLPYKYTEWAQRTGLLLIGVAIESSENHLKSHNIDEPHQKPSKNHNKIEELRAQYNVLKHNNGVIPTQLTNTDKSAKKLVRKFKYKRGDSVFKKQKFDMQKAIVEAYIYFFNILSDFFGQKKPMKFEPQRILKTLNFVHPIES